MAEKYTRSGRVHLLKVTGTVITIPRNKDSNFLVLKNIGETSVSLSRNYNFKFEDGIFLGPAGEMTFHGKGKIYARSNNGDVNFLEIENA